MHLIISIHEMRTRKNGHQQRRAENNRMPKNYNLGNGHIVKYSMKVIIEKKIIKSISQKTGENT